MASNAIAAARARITHLEVVDPLDHSRFGSLNATADVQVACDFTQPVVDRRAAVVPGPTQDALSRHFAARSGRGQQAGEEGQAFAPL